MTFLYVKQVSSSNNLVNPKPQMTKQSPKDNFPLHLNIWDLVENERISEEQTSEHQSHS